MEGKATFYATASVATVKTLGGLTDPDFRFVFKLPKQIAYECRLADSDTFTDSSSPR